MQPALRPSMPNRKPSRALCASGALLGLQLLSCTPGQAPVALDAPRTDVGPPLCSEVPTSGFGVEVGQRYEGFALPSCDERVTAFYDASFCDPSHSLTVLSFAAEWCAPCRIESRLLQSRIVAPFAARGVRVVQVLTENLRMAPADAQLCREWVTDHGLENVTEVYDPTASTSALTTGGLPSTYLIDETGTIVFEERGTSDELRTLVAAIERELTRLGR